MTVKILLCLHFAIFTTVTVIKKLRIQSYFRQEHVLRFKLNQTIKPFDRSYL
jgi:hypothetical protein